MRLAFVRSLIDARKKDERIHLLTGDLGFEVFEEFVEKFPQSFTNVGVAEANMVGMASGMAHLGFKCICYSITPFLVFRALEQIRNDVCYHNLDVKIVGVGGGLGYSSNGQSHTTLEDIAVMRSLPNMTVLCPGDPLETYMATKQMLAACSPTYLRLGKKGETNLMYEHIGNFEIGKPVCLREGQDLLVFSVGNMLEATINAMDELAKRGLNPTHVHVHTIKPINAKDFQEIMQKHTHIVTVEEHSIIGGLGNMISEINSTGEFPLKKMLMLGLEDKYFNIGGTQRYLRNISGLDSTGIVMKVSEFFKK